MKRPPNGSSIYATDDVPGNRPREVLKIGADFYILASSVVGRRGTRVIANGQGFAVLDVAGDISGSPLEPMGYFNADTRYLSRFELRVAGQVPAFLSSHLSDDHAQLKVNLTNADLTDGAETVVLSRNSVQIERSCVLNGD